MKPTNHEIAIRLENTIKKGFTAFNRCKPLVFMVGTIGFEPTTSTVSR